MVPMKAIQQTANGFANVGSNAAAMRGAVVVWATTPPGKRTGSAANAAVIAVQKKMRGKSIPSGGGTETLMSTTSPAEMTGYTRGRSFRGTLSESITGGQNTRGGLLCRISAATKRELIELSIARFYAPLEDAN